MEKIVIIEKDLGEYSQGIEIVESKHRGHPDRICEEAARIVNQTLEELAQELIQGQAHFLVDSVMLSSGEISDLFTAPRIERPFVLILSGQASEILRTNSEFENRIEQRLSSHFKEVYGLTLGEEFIIRNLITSSSPELEINFDRKRCSDTAFVVGYGTSTRLEKVATQLESFFDHLRMKVRSIGQDVKVLLMSSDPETIEVILSVAMIRQYLQNLATYQAHLYFIEYQITNFLRDVFDYRKISIYINQADFFDLEELRQHTTWEQTRLSSVYLTRSGLSAEHQDDGSLGRANQNYNKTALNRPQTNETIVGKNPHHSSVLYHEAATEISKIIDKHFETRSEVAIVAKIGNLISEPHLIKIAVDKTQPYDFLEIQEIAQKAFESFIQKQGA